MRRAVPIAICACLLMLPLLIDAAAPLRHLRSKQGNGPGGTAIADIDLNGVYKLIVAADGADYIYENGGALKFATNGTDAVGINAGTFVLYGGRDIDLYNASFLYSSTKIAWLGGAGGTGSHSLGSGAIGVNGPLELDSETYVDDRLIHAVGTLGDTDTTPDVAGGNLFVSQDNTGATAITDLDNPVAGQTVTICVGGTPTNAPTIADGGNFNLSANWTPGLDDCITLLVQADNDYIELSRVDN